MNPTRKSKIARLPKSLRDEINRHIDDGTPGPQLLAWLNLEPVVLKILNLYFKGRLITKQNLSEWRQGGYQDWINSRETRDLTLELVKDPESRDLGISARKINDAIVTLAAAEFLHTTDDKLRECTNLDQRWKTVCKIQDQVSRLRHDQYRVDNLAFRQQCWNYEPPARHQAFRQAAEAGKLLQNHSKCPEVQANPAKSM